MRAFLPVVLAALLAACSGHSATSARSGAPPTSVHAACVRVGKDLAAEKAQLKSVGIYDAKKREAIAKQTFADVQWDVSALPAGNVIRRDDDRMAGIGDRVATMAEEGVSNPISAQD